jgi:D-3-phosphoglycerate dehydrogenase / 2-oxoglutarate reductase
LYDDRPGIVGAVGRILGDENVNIAGMQVSRDTKGGKALMSLTVDTAIGNRVLADIVAAVGAHSGRSVDLDD